MMLNFSCGISSMTITTPHNPLHLSTADNTENAITRTHLDHINDTIAEHGAHHPAVANGQNTLGLIYHHVLHQENEAFLCHLTALRTLLTCYQKPQHHSDSVVIQISTTIHDLGNVHWANGHREKAIDAFREALGLLLGIGLTASHPRYLSVDNRLTVMVGSRPKEICPIIIDDELILLKRFCTL